MSEYVVELSPGRKRYVTVPEDCDARISRSSDGKTFVVEFVVRDSGPMKTPETLAVLAGVVAFYRSDVSIDESRAGAPRTMEIPYTSTR